IPADHVRGFRTIAGTMNRGGLNNYGGPTVSGGTSSCDRIPSPNGSRARKWARPDLDWRPSGYQPDAPTRLSYGPAKRRKTTNRLKDSFEVRPPTAATR